MLPGFAPYLVCCPLFSAAIPQIPLAHDIDERRKLAGTGVGAVDAVADGDEAHPEFAKEDFRIKSSLKIVTANPAHVLCDDTADLASFNIGNQPLPIGPVEVPAGPAVIGVVDAVVKAMLSGVALQLHFLICD